MERQVRQSFHPLIACPPAQGLLLTLVLRVFPLFLPLG
jgi:hypothetical protein